MSYDLLVWRSPVPADVRQAKKLVERYDPTAFEASPALGEFVAALLRELPAIADDPTRSVWSVTPVPTDRLLELNLSWNTPDPALLRIFELADEHGLVVYDPAGPKLYPPKGR